MSTKMQFFEEINNTPEEQGEYEYEQDRAEWAELQESEGAK